ncbi:hypothetical protein CKO44_00330 [Rubrivivax gelatinosus]|uniref:Uncharacterized protein n=1 Tax=Rubrivivax gelatinosus TaxID=28068 RepID=A0ABS1DQ37_RUBGE|nr:hypothetical protein [Rubrivivax gelatinosus]MBK1711573.1 hypothetical protein [Rubrivivax gelatinosus]
MNRQLHGAAAAGHAQPPIESPHSRVDGARAERELGGDLLARQPGLEIHQQRAVLLIQAGEREHILVRLLDPPLVQFERHGARLQAQRRKGRVVVKVARRRRAQA